MFGPIPDFFMRHADFEFAGIYLDGGKHILRIVDTCTNTSAESTFANECEMLKFVGEYLSNSDGSSAEFIKRYPAHG